MVSKTDYAWAAGFIEGEGSFSLRVYNRKFSKYVKKQNGIKTYIRKMVQPVIQASQNNPAPLKKLRNLTQFPIFKFSKGGNGHGNNIYYRIQIVGLNRLIPFLIGIRPYLSQKTEQCDLLLEVCKRQGKRGTNKYTMEQWNWFEDRKKEIEKLNAYRSYNDPK